MRDEDFEALYARNAESLFGFLAYRTGDRLLAEDLLADTFERVLRARRRYDPQRAGERTWLYTIALNLLRDHSRRTGAESRALERVGTGPEGESSLEATESRHDVARAMHVLSDPEREAIALRYGGGLTVPEIARLKRERLTTIEGRVYRGLQKLRGELAPDD